jgi:hypothetical protein
MEEAKAQQIIIIAAFITIASTSLAELKGVPQAKTLKPHRTIVGGFFAFVGCSIIAEFDPKTGMLLALMVSGGTFVKYGLPTIESYYAPEPSPAGHPGKKIVGTKVVKNKAGGPVEVPIYRTK